MDTGVTPRKWVAFRTKSNAAVVTYRTDEEFGVELTLYRTVKGEVAMGITNHTIAPDGRDLYAVFLELDNHERNAEDIVLGLAKAGLAPFLIARTSRGWHVISRDFAESKVTVVKVMKRLAEAGLCDPGFVELAEIRLKDPEAHFTNLLRVQGKYAERDIVVKRVTPAPTIWHRRVWNLYLKYAKVEVSATRYAVGCLGYTPHKTKEMEWGKWRHSAWELEMAEQGWETEKEFTYETANAVYTGVVDAVRDEGDHIAILEYKTRKREAEKKRTERQARFYANLVALAARKPAVVRVVTDSETVTETAAIPGTARLPAPEDLLAPLPRACRSCALRGCLGARRLF